MKFEIQTSLTNRLKNRYFLVKLNIGTFGYCRKAVSFNVSLVAHMAPKEEGMQGRSKRQKVFDWAS